MKKISENEYTVDDYKLQYVGAFMWMIYRRPPFGGDYIMQGLKTGGHSSELNAEKVLDDYHFDLIGIDNSGETFN